ncbi:MAG: hypothetical protein JXA54_16585 [Candidatus Heimdallarchaeota archaeon]|nr:hypothetical protein [Candidatus Heimdallarchaeota archaeon]
MNFDNDRKKQLMMVLIIASAIIPVYIIYLTFGNPPLQVSLFSIIYSFFVVFIWLLFYFDFFRKKPTFNGTNGNLAIKQE